MTTLLCDDGSDCARDAIAAAGRVLRGGPAVVLHVVVSLAPEVFRGEADSLPEVAEAHRVAAVGAEAARAAGFDAKPAVQVTAADAGDAIVGYAATHGADVIVVGARGRSTMKSLLLGGVSLDVVQQARVPVLVVHAEAAEA